VTVSLPLHVTGKKIINIYTNEEFSAEASVLQVTLPPYGFSILKW
ncbi:alpha-glucosidase C-terminal domain-containing protein, partial [Bacillus sp. HC-Mk]